MAILTKAELLASFPDNTAGDISAEDIRNFVESNLTLEIQAVTSSPFNVVVTTDALILGPGASVVNLTSVAGFKDRTLVIINKSGGTVTVNPDGTDTIEELTSLSMNDLRVVSLAAESTAPNWDILIDNETTLLRLTDTPSSYSGQAGKTLSVNSGEDAIEFTNPATQTAVFFEETNTNLTTINDLVTFEDLNISIAASGMDTLSGFSVSGNTITKDSAGTGLFYLTWMTDGEPDTGASRAYTMKMFKNGSTSIPGASKLSVTANLPETAGVLALVSLTLNDTVDLKVRADTNIVDFLSINNCISFRRAD